MLDKNIDDEVLCLLEQELKGNRYGKDYCQRMLKAGRQFLDWIKDKREIQRLRRRDLMNYQVYLGKCKNAYTGKPLSFSTIKHRYEAVKKICSILYRTGNTKENLSHGLDFKTNEVRLFKRRPLSREEITNFLDGLSDEDCAGLRNRAFFELIYSSGLRVSEAVTLKIGNIDFNRREITIRGKFDRERIVPFSNIAYESLLNFLGDRKDVLDDYVFPGRKKDKHILRTSMIRIFRKLLKSCGIDKKELCIHSIRHSTATHLLDNGAGVRQVQELLGHKSIESTVLYTHIQTEGLARIYRKYHPREHELFEMTDKNYENRLNSILRDHKGRLLTGKRLPKIKKHKEAIKIKKEV